MAAIGDCPPPNSPELDQWVNKLAMKDLKNFIVSRGLSCEDCLEKPDFHARAKQAAAKPPGGVAEAGGETKRANNNARPQTAARDDIQSLVMKRKVFSGYKCEVYAPESVHAGKVKPDLVFIFLHGWGATNDNVAGIASMCEPATRGKAVYWVFPQAPPDDISPAAWWQINVEEWARSRADVNKMAKIIRESFPGLPECRQRMLKLVDEVLAATETNINQLVLGGFSQGAMTAMDVALSLPSTPAGLLSISGAPIVVEEWAKKLPARKGFRVIITHGRSDPILFFQGSVWLKEMLEKAGVDVKYCPHNGAHDFGDPSVIVAFVKELASTPNS